MISPILPAARAALQRRLDEARPGDLSKAFAAWLLPLSKQAADFPYVIDLAVNMLADHGFQTIAILGFGAAAGALSETQGQMLARSLVREALQNPVLDGVPLNIRLDPIALFGVSVGTAALRDANVSRVVVAWIAESLKLSYESGQADDWQRCLVAAANIQLGSPLKLSVPKSIETADVRTVLAARGLFSAINTDEIQADALNVVELAAHELLTDSSYDRVALRLAALEWINRTGRRFADAKVPYARAEGSVEWIDPTQHHDDLARTTTTSLGSDSVSTDTHNPEKHLLSTTAEEAECESPELAFASDPTIRKPMEKETKQLENLNLIKECGRAIAEAEVMFREGELNGSWAEWAGVFPWEGTRDPETTDCPWWRAGAEYLFHFVAAWRKHSRGEPLELEKLLMRQIDLMSKWVYWHRVYLYDLLYGKNSTVDHVRDGHADRFSNIAFIIAMRRFAEQDLREWRSKAALLAESRSDLSVETSIPRTPGASDRGSPVAASLTSDPMKERAREEALRGHPTDIAQPFTELDDEACSPALLVGQDQVPKGSAGRPPNERTFELHKAWVEMGRPKITVQTCDDLAKMVFPDECAKVKRGSNKHKNLRDRCRAAIQRIEKKLATKSIS